jgi:uncharacterized protein (DUF2141 family)
MDIMVFRAPPGAGRALFLATLAALSAGTAARATPVQIVVTGVAQARGHVRVELCTRDTFLTTRCPYQGVAPATVGATLVTISDAPSGEYAVQAFQDVTDEGVVHQNFLGIPKERIGFSNDAPLHLSGPRFSEAAIWVGHGVERITLRLRKIFVSGR